MLMINDKQGDALHDLHHAKTMHDKYTHAQRLSLAERQVLDNLPNIPINNAKTIKHTLTHFHWHLSLVYINIDKALYNNINHALTAIHADFVWQKGCDGLGVPKAMGKLVGQA